MTRTLRNCLLPLLLTLTAALTAAPPAIALADPPHASSRIRSLRGRMQVEVPARAAMDVLDSLTSAAQDRGYALVERNTEKLRTRLERPATLGEVGALGWRFENTERRRLDFEIASVKRRPDRLAVVGAITLVQNPGAENEQDEDMGRLQPYRAELRSLLEHARAVFGP